MASFLTRRDGFWHFARRVPTEFAALDPRGVVKQSTKIKIADDRNGAKAAGVAEQMNAVLEGYWKGLVEGKAAEAQDRYDAARKRARAMGLEYAPAANVADMPLADILARVERLMEEKAVGETDRARGIRAAVLGGEELPKILLSELFTKFEDQVTADLTDLSPDQRRKWRNPKVRALTNLITVIGDKPITQITTNDALDFSEWWQARVVDEDLNPGTANKDMGHIGRMIFVVNKRYRLGIGKVFDGMRLEGGIENSRPPYDPVYVQTKILAPGALAGLNSDARRVVFLIAGAGLRPSEAVNLNRKTINLENEIPFVSVVPEGRRLKTPQSRRDVPLCGVALEAMRAQPDGFPPYHDNSATLSATVNKFLGEHDLRQGGDRTLYSLRHTFKDRLTEADAEDSMIDALMGHKETGSKYGAGPSLKLKLKFVHRIAFTPPRDV